MKYTLLLALILSAHANAQCFSPSPPGVDCAPKPSGPSQLCLPSGCSPVTYSWYGTLAVAESTLPNHYPVLGWAGPCVGSCPDIFNQAFTDLEMNAKRANRAQRYED